MHSSSSGSSSGGGGGGGSISRIASQSLEGVPTLSQRRFPSALEWRAFRSPWGFPFLGLSWSVRARLTSPLSRHYSAEGDVR